ncbi:ABC-F family ATP-binding cassette domain-containing protein [Liquorilactobacillus oeni]|uniref:ABC transporter ATP-binding protein n=1 Tax=Liquorilactobacillus oeni DSM 19972 TaxID=1423777 RepID=A0A0R1M9X3_9LACO|nr:ABC-F family ATP-binding cassette domain-containing protein [Liquorilactobacillus oeni]KRL04854.1 ABC transporter ATP-binding protein [Liquorilactobacillus oeni DSM 19972]
MILLQVQKAARFFGSDVLFENVNLDIQEKSRIALVGHNGVGKSTLVKIIVGQQSADQGQIIKNKKLTIGYLAQDTGLETENTIYEEMLTVFKDLQQMENTIHKLEQKIAAGNENNTEYQNILKTYDQLQHDFKEANGYGYESEIRSVLHGFNFFEKDYQRKVATLSGGQKTRLALAKLLLEKKDLLILDEPTNHLDIKTLGWLENYLQTYSGALLLISHDRYFLDKVAREVYELTPKGAEHYTGNYSSYIQKKETRYQQKLKEYEKQQAKIEKLEDFVARNIVRASTTKRAQSRRKQLEKMQRLEKPDTAVSGPHFQFTAKKQSGNLVLKVAEAYIGYDNYPISGPINIELKKHQIMAIIGPNGIGKSTLLKSVLGKVPLLRGNVRFGTNVEVGYYDQELKNLHANKTVLQELWDEHPTTSEGDIRSILGSFLFSGDDVKKLVHNLSGGEKARLLLTKLAFDHDNFLIFDEPTNHLDINSKEVLETALQNFDGTVLFISHDRYFINKLAGTVLELSSKGSRLYLGDYDYYLDKKEEERAIKEAQAEKKPVFNTELKKPLQGNYFENKELQKKKRKLLREISSLEQQIEELDLKTNKLQQLMTLPENYKDPAKIKKLQEKLKKAEASKNQLEEQWEEKSFASEDLT